MGVWSSRTKYASMLIVKFFIPLFMFPLETLDLLCYFDIFIGISCFQVIDGFICYGIIQVKHLLLAFSNA